jgi:hypothetical protein
VYMYGVCVYVSLCEFVFSVVVRLELEGED